MLPPSSRRLERGVTAAGNATPARQLPLAMDRLAAHLLLCPTCARGRAGRWLCVRRRHLIRVAVALAAAGSLAGCGGLMPHAGGSSSAVAVPTPARVVLAGRSVPVSSFSVGKPAIPFAPPPIPPGTAAVVSYRGVATPGTAGALQVLAPIRLVFVKVGLVVAVRSLPRCAVSCRTVTVKRAYDTVVAVGTRVRPPHAGARVTFS